MTALNVGSQDADDETTAVRNEAENVANDDYDNVYNNNNNNNNNDDDNHIDEDNNDNGDQFRQSNGGENDVGNQDDIDGYVY